MQHGTKICLNVSKVEGETEPENSFKKPENNDLQERHSFLYKTINWQLMYDECSIAVY